MTIQGTMPLAETRRSYQPQQYAPQTESVQPSARDNRSRRFDSVTISSEGEKACTMEARSRIAQDVRTATSSGQVSALREQVRSGSYQPDPMEIARKMLLLGGGG